MPDSSAPSGAAVPLAAKIAFLRQAKSYPEAPSRIEVIETHMAWVFLGDTQVYKLKKPVQAELLDMRTVAARQHLCHEEVRLNRRLAPQTYLGVVPLALSRSGQLQLGAHDQAEVVDWLVQMRRLPRTSMLDYLLRHGKAEVSHMHRIAQRLLVFHEALAPQLTDPRAYRQRLARQLLACQRELSASASASGLPAALIDQVCKRLRLTLRRQAGWFEQRAAGGKIIEGHGDLRPEHVCVDAEVEVIDCLEFSRQLRLLDRADEVAYLALEIARLGKPALGQALLHAYRVLSHDRPAGALLHFYQAYRALLRATLAVRHLYEQQYRSSPIWAARAHDYLLLAEQFSTPAVCLVQRAGKRALWP